MSMTETAADQGDKQRLKARDLNELIRYTMWAVFTVNNRDFAREEAAVLDNLEQRANRALAAIPRARDRREADRARPELRRRLLQSLGIPRLPWPPG